MDKKTVFEMVDEWRDGGDINEIIARRCGDGEMQRGVVRAIGTCDQIVESIKTRLNNSSKEECDRWWLAIVEYTLQLLQSGDDFKQIAGLLMQVGCATLVEAAERAAEMEADDA